MPRARGAVNELIQIRESEDKFQVDAIVGRGRATFLTDDNREGAMTSNGGAEKRGGGENSKKTRISKSGSITRARHRLSCWETKRLARIDKPSKRSNYRGPFRHRGTRHEKSYSLIHARYPSYKTNCDWQAKGNQLGKLDTSCEKFARETAGGYKRGGYRETWFNL